jgi:hypothetical protein
MKKINTLLLLTLSLVIGLSFSGCKKYEEGPAISLNTKMHRVVNTWVVEQVFETPTNGTKTDRTGDYKTAYANFVWTFTKDEDYAISFNPYSMSSYNETGRWEFGGDKINILLFNDNGGNSWIGDLWRILRLKEKELWMKTVNGNGVTIEVHFIPQ